ncbi:sensor histidine kinase [Trueperella pecoris]|uniref:sensor histidine kinase n=1 Tax=Trueperella pecoris TaxID=2733571 RepID=UPI00186B644B|nr:HAMP domain-containing sensor histidine kinase [Trueperella pecoris]QOQ39747.1 HAMP domain-containing histidine kinase [Trueperella pecoris]
MFRKIRLTARARLALSYSILIIICSIILLAAMTIYLSFIPNNIFDFSPDDDAWHASPIIYLHESNVELTVESGADLFALLLRLSAIALLVLTVLSSLVAWWLAGRMLRPLAKVSEAATQAAKGHLDHRISFTGPKDEITNLIDSFNTMLDAIERSAAAQRRFTANASHELRTPLATTRTILEVALAKKGDVDRTVLEKLVKVNERSTQTIEALLDLAQLESDALELAHIDLADVVHKVLQEAQDDVSSRHLSVSCDLQPAITCADARLVYQLVRNLIHNAIHHNVESGNIFIETTTTTRTVGTHAHLTVRNTGLHLDPSTMNELTEPFWTSRGRVGQEHRGLGLSIVSAIVDRFGAQLTLKARHEGGLEVRVDFAA